MTFEKFEQQFREARPSPEDLKPTEKTFDVMEMAISENQKYFPHRKMLLFAASIAIIFALTTIVLFPRNETLTVMVATTIQSSSTTSIGLVPTGGFDYSSTGNTIKRKINALNNQKSCLPILAYRLSLTKFLRESNIHGWKIVVDSSAKSSKCASADINSVAQEIRLSYR